MSAHVDRHEIVTRLQVLIVTSSEVAIPDYLKGITSADLLAAAQTCDNLLKGGADSNDMHAVTTAKARGILLGELQLRGEQIPAPQAKAPGRGFRWPWKR